MIINWAKINNTNIVENICIFEIGITPSNETLPEGWKWICDDENIKNSPMIGGTYSSEYNGFIPIKPFDSWSLNTETCLWESPTPKPSDGRDYNWNEETQEWELDPDYNE